MRHRFTRRLLLFLYVYLLSLGTPTFAAETWQARDLSLEMGNAVPLTTGLRVSPNESGQVYIAIPVRKTNLAEQHLLSIEFGGKPPPVIFAIWHNDIQPDQVFQFKLPPQQQDPVVFDMSTVQGWEGNATRFGIGLRLLPGQQLIIRSVSLGAPTLATEARGIWQNWSNFRPWKQVDINIHTGTRQFGEGPHPMLAFALFSLLGLGLYWLATRLRSSAFSVRIGGAIVLIAWIFLDLFWQVRMFKQASLTVDTFGGLDTNEKLLASPDADLVRFTALAKEKITDHDARVFIASSDDYEGMRSAYYMSPLNTYWHRRGPELPATEQLQAGDYLLLVAPSSVELNLQAGRLRYGNNEPVTIEPVLNDQLRLLMKVTQ